MTLSFALVIAVLFAMVFALESFLCAGDVRLRQYSLIRWISTENWPAKVGAILLIVGVGALLRYAMIHLTAPDHLKIIGGILLSGSMGAAAYACRLDQARRALHFALTGAAFGIAYLCAYASFGFFGYIDDEAGIALLLTVAIFAAVYAATARSVSIAVLSMVGAYAAPAFAVTPKGPLIVLGYYTLVSLLAFVLVVARAWRPLIHLSFLFTLGGSLFFSWTQGYFRPEHFDVMQPLLLVLVAIHVAMPLAEQGAVRKPWLMRLDTVYLFLLPACSALLMWSITPRLDPDTALGFVMLGTIWLVAGGFAWWIRRDAFAAHLSIGAMLVLAGLLIHFQDLSWPLIGLLLSTASIVVSVRLGATGGFLALAGTLALICHVLFALDGHRFPQDGLPFLNQALAENVVVAVALLGAGLSLNGRGGMIGAALLIAGGLWGALVVMAELIRIDVPLLPQLIQCLLIIATLFLTRMPAAGASRETALFVAVVLLVPGSLWSAADNYLPVALVLAAGTLSALLLVFRGRLLAQDSARPAFPFETFALPAVAFIWGVGISYPLDAPETYLGFAVLAATMSAMVLLAHTHASRQSEFNNFLLPVMFVVASVVLLYAHVAHIERGAWPVVAELVGLAFIAVVVLTITDRDEARAPTIILAVLAALMLQAQVLRLYGPPGILSMADIARITWPAVTSLLWALIGATLAWISQRMASRVVWSVGTALMAVSAAKLIMFDFGSLGELENILALIGAGCLFLLVAWLVPLPPKRRKAELSRSLPPLKSYVALADPPSTTSRKREPGAGGEGDRVSNDNAGPASIPAAQAGNGIHPKTTLHPGEWRGERPANGVVTVLIVGATAVLLLAGVMRLGDFSPSRSSAQAASRIPMVGVPVPSPAEAPPEPVKPDAVAVVAGAEPPGMGSGEIAAIPASPPAKPITPCEQFVKTLPERYVLFAGGAYRGIATGRSIDASGHEATRFIVRVSETSTPVVLALGAYEPSVWKVVASPGTEIVGIVLAGYHRQMLESGPADVPVLVSTYDNGSPCGYFSSDPRNFLAKFFGKQATVSYDATGGLLRMGSGAQFNASDDAEMNPAPVGRLAGEAGIEQLLKEGKLRRAGARDVQGIPGFSDSQETRQSNFYRLGRVYVVNGEFEIPAGLYGAHSVTIIVPRGMPHPSGNRGHSTVIDMNLL